MNVVNTLNQTEFSIFFHLNLILFFKQKADKNILYPAASVFVNLTNSYEKPDIMPEMIELAKYSKQHVPEEHEKVR